MKKSIITILLILFSLSGIYSQEPPLVLDKQGTFELQARTDYNNYKCGFTKTEMAANLEQIKNVVAIVRQNEVLANPVGFQGIGRIYDVHCDDYGAYGIPARVSFGFASYFITKSGSVGNITIEPSDWSVYLNKQNPTGHVFHSEIFDRKHGMFSVPIDKETLANGVDIYDNSCYVIYDPERPDYWLPVTVDEAFDAVREYWNSQTDKETAREMLVYVEKEYDEIPVSERNNQAYYGGFIARVSSSSGYENEENLFPRIMKVNPEYWNRQLPRSSIQIMYCVIEGDKEYRHNNTEEALRANSISYHKLRFVESIDLDMLTSLRSLIGR